MSELWSQCLLSLGHGVQRHLRRIIAKSDEDLALPIAHEGGDTIFAIDRHVEPIIEEEIERWPVELQSLILIAEGMGTDGRRRFGAPEETPRYRVIVDPIDGTRGLMYDKRSAWFIAAVAENNGEATTLADAFAAVLVELPTSKQHWCDAFVATTDSRASGFRSAIDGDDIRPLSIRPSRAADLRFGFGQVTSFFPGTKALAADLAERIASEALGPANPGEALLFEDQYISSGGQMVELMMGHDRFTCDLRPLFYRILAGHSAESIRGLECHPYDVAGALVARQAGIIITDGFGDPLDPPLDVSTGVHWCGFANEALASQIQPIIARWLREHGI